MTMRPFLAVAMLTALTACAVGPRDMPKPMIASNPATADFMTEMHDMNTRMHATPPANDTSRDFVAMMKPHHQAAVEMAKTYLQYGKDPELRRMAHAIIVGQTKEIAEMDSWQKHHKAATP